MREHAARTVGRGAPCVLGARGWPAESVARLSNSHPAGRSYRAQRDDIDRSYKRIKDGAAAAGKKSGSGRNRPPHIFSIHAQALHPRHKRTRHSERTSRREPRVVVSERAN
jgi:hypothetical protein